MAARSPAMAATETSCDLPANWCNPSSCSGWKEIFEFKLEGNVGDMPCLLQAVQSGASFYVISTGIGDSVHHVTVLETTYDSANDVAYFFFEPIFAHDMSGKGRIVYFTASTDGLYQAAVYSMSHTLIASVTTLPLRAKIFVRLVDCNENGQPVIFKTEATVALYDPNDSIPLIRSNNEAAVLTLQLHTSSSTDSFRGDWTIYDSDRVVTFAAVNFREKAFEFSSGVGLTNPSTSDYRMIGANGATTELKYDKERGDVVRKSSYSQLAWFCDSCWRPVYKFESKGNEVNEYSLQTLMGYLLTGSAIRVQFSKTSDNTVHTASALKVSCSAGSCQAVLRNHPKYDSSNPFKFSVNGTNSYVLFGSYLEGAMWTSYKLSTPLTIERNYVDVTWSARFMIYTEVFVATKDAVVINRVPLYTNSGAEYRMAVYHDPPTTVSFYEIQYVVHLSNGAREFHTRHMTEWASTCVYGELATIEWALTVSSKSFSLWSNVWLWDYQTLCAHQQPVGFTNVTIFASTAQKIEED